MQQRSAFDPEHRYDVRTWDMECRRVGEDALGALIYQPSGPGPFPMLLDVHGGAWHSGSRTQNALLDGELAAAGMVVMALDFRSAPQHPYPAQVVDVHYATRWLKAHASELNGDPDTLGGLGTSSGGHTVLLSAMRPSDPRYGAFPLEEGPDVDSTLKYVLALWGVLDPYARYFFALETGREALAARGDDYFLSKAAMQEGNPQMLLERGEQEDLPAVLIIQPTPDGNIPRSMPERFVEAYRAAGGSIELEWFEGARHGFARKPSPETDRALGLMKAFVGRQLAALGTA